MIKDCSSVFILLCLCNIFVLSGCGKNDRPEGFPKIYPATVTLTQDGTPLEGAAVSFHPEGSDNKWGSGGTTDAQGKVKVVTYGKFDGIPEGKFKVTVIKTYEENPPMAHGDPPATGVFSLVPLMYNSKKTTDLEMEVKPSKEGNLFEFNLGAPVKIKL